jgi:hypothetical protein
MKLRSVLVLVVLLIAAAGAYWWTRRLPDDSANRQRFFSALQPVALKGCELQRFGEPNDGGYLVCANLLPGAESVYSYGISGYDKLGCDLSTKLQAAVHRYDCFNTTDPPCPTGKAVFHAECVGATREVSDGRTFDTVENQVRANGDTGRRLIVKMDIEGAEWDSLLAVSDDQLSRIDQLIMELHIGRHRSPIPFVPPVPIVEDRYVQLLDKIKATFHVANLHFNNASCVDGFDPFPSYAVEVLFVNKRLAEIDPTAKAPVPNPLDRPNVPNSPECR